RCSAVLPPETRFPAVVLAGGRSSPEFAAESGAEYRALVDIGGWPMVRYVLRALRTAKTIGPVILVAPSAFPPEPEADQQLAGDGDIASNLILGMQACGSAEFAFIATADIPFLTPESVDHYVLQCLSAPGDCLYSAIPLEACRKRFPEMRRTALQTPAGAFTGGNVVFQRVAAVERQLETLRSAHRSRKNPLFLARLIGPGNLLRFVARRLTLEQIGAAASRVMGVDCRLVVSPYAELGADVDKPDDLRIARRLLRRPDCD
ncbi:MAG TPA: nucleotidyltransferase family protein, partial [Armatimonadota bacterium]|nr:nucleotidyltransferase family protein [Armatimonadota bacterium]